jgi:hypothetical protein
VSKRRDQPTIPEPIEDVRSLRTSVAALKELVEIMAGQRGAATDAVPTWQDLIDLGLVTKSRIPEGIGGPPRNK